MPRESPKDLEQLRDVIKFVFWVIPGRRERTSSEAGLAEPRLHHDGPGLARCLHSSALASAAPAAAAVCEDSAYEPGDRGPARLATKTTTIVEEPLLLCAFQTVCS